MKIGTTIQNEDMTLTVVAYHETKNSNVVLLVREKGCHYVTARDLTRKKNGTYHWYYGHYTDDFEAAAQDYSERKAELQ